MHLWIGRDRDFKVMAFGQAFDQVGGISVTAGRGLITMSCALDGITSERHDAAHPHVPIGIGNAVDFLGRCSDTGQVGHGRDRRLRAQMLNDLVGSVSSGSVGSVSYRNKLRRQFS